MFGNIYVASIKTSVRSLDSIVWTWVFPILLATLFYFTFANLDSVNLFEPVKTAVVKNAAYQKDAAFSQAVESVSEEGENQVLDAVFVGSVEEADELLDKGEVEGYLSFDGEPKLAVKGTGINQTILKSFLDSYQQTAHSVSGILKFDPAAMQKGLAKRLSERGTFTKEISLSNSQPTEKVNYFYALLAMVSMYGGFVGMSCITRIQANLSPLGARRSLAPIGKFRMLVYDLLGKYTMHTLCMLVVVAYIIFVLRIDFGPKLLFVILTCIVGSLVGVALGALVATITRHKEGVKTGILVGFTMICCFLAGLMTSGINYVIAKNLPVLAWINPAARITDAFYCLYYYDTLDRYFLNIGILLAMAAVLFGISSLVLRRRQYESI